MELFLRGDSTTSFLNEFHYIVPSFGRRTRLESFGVMEHKTGLGGERNFIPNIV